jgi:hypothetical protein
MAARLDCRIYQLPNEKIKTDYDLPMRDECSVFNGTKLYNCQGRIFVGAESPVRRPQSGRRMRPKNKTILCVYPGPALFPLTRLR